MVFPNPERIFSNIGFILEKTGLLNVIAPLLGFRRLIKYLWLSRRSDS